MADFTTFPIRTRPVDLYGVLATISADLAASREHRLAAEAAAGSINLRAGIADAPALKALDTTQWKAAILGAGWSQGIYIWTEGDFSIPHGAEDGADFFYIKANAVDVTEGCWVRLVFQNDPADFHGFRARDDRSVAFTVEALEGAVARFRVTPGTPVQDTLGPDFGPTISVEGDAANIPGYLAAKGSGGWVFGNALGKLFELVSGAAGYVASRIPKIRPGSTASGEYASIDAEDGFDLKASGNAVLRILAGAGGASARLDVSNPGANFIMLSTQAGKSLVLSAPSGLQFQHIRVLQHDWQAFTVNNGDAIAPNPFAGLVLVNPSSNPIAALTINLPAAPVEGLAMTFSFRASITTLTWASLGGHNIIGAPAAGARLDPVTLMYFGPTWGWQRT